MATRLELYQRWSPELIEAVALVLMDEINILRTDPTTTHTARNSQQMGDAIWAKLESLPNIPWGT